MLYIANAFSIQMLGDTQSCTLGIYKTDPESVSAVLKKAVAYVSAIGHEDTARVVSNILGVEIPANRISITLKRKDFLIVTQYTGPRLPEGATTLPEGAKIEFWGVWVS